MRCSPSCSSIALLRLAGRNPGNGLEPPRRGHASSGPRRWFAETDRHRSSAPSILFSYTRTLAKLTKSQGAKREPTVTDSGRRRRLPATIIAAKYPIGRHRATYRDDPEVPSKQRVAGWNPAGRAHFAPRNLWRQTVARAGCHSTLHTVFTSSASRPQVMLATLGYRQRPQAALQ
jgi:hypothetical protein